jgi:hypothetical protein
LYSQLAALYSFAGDGEGMPTQGVKDVFADYTKELDRTLGELDRFYTEKLADLNGQAKAKDWPTIALPPKP